ncbi:hypothetical protein tb265_31410 [Gemmatimonadetes bacterium T265]|nr:hypothetical protein tb265_31410 [Gemmatimonadetes bacterium T265]
MHRRGAVARDPGRDASSTNPSPSATTLTSPAASGSTLRSAAARFLVAGGTNAAGTFLIFRLLLRVAGDQRWAASLAQASAYATGVAVSYVVNRRWTFGSTAPHGRTAVRFLVAHGGSLLLSLLTIQLGVWSGRLTASVWWVIATGATTVTNFVLQRYWVFAHPES